MSEKKKIMPAIMNYLSDSDDDFDDIVVDTLNTHPVKPNYADWKRSQKVPNNTLNGNRSIPVPLGDISSCEEDSKFDDNEPLFKVMNCLADKNSFRKRNETLRKKHKKPSNFLLYGRLKQQRHFDLTFNDLCQITQTSWSNAQSVENEDLLGNIDVRMREYREILLNLKRILLRATTGRVKHSVSISDYAPSSSSSSSLSSPPPSSSPPASAAAITDHVHHTHIPERLQNLAGNASVYNAPDKSKRVPTHQYNTFKSRNRYGTDTTSLTYVIDKPVANHNCKYRHCENTAIDDYRWDGQYCSVECLLLDCNWTLQNWVTEQLEPINAMNGDKSEEEKQEKQEKLEKLEKHEKNSKKEEKEKNSTKIREKEEKYEVLIYLSSPRKQSSPLSDVSLSRDENIFESLQKRSCNDTTTKFTFDTDIDASGGGSRDPVAATRLHSLITRSKESPTNANSDGTNNNNIPLQQDFEYFHDRTQQSVTETTK